MSVISNGKSRDRSLQYFADYRSCLGETGEKLAANLESSPLIRRDGYGPADDRPTLLDRAVPEQCVHAPHPCGTALTRVQNRNPPGCASAAEHRDARRAASRRFCAGFPPGSGRFMQQAG